VLKNELKILLSMETYEKGKPMLKRSLLEPPTLDNLEESLEKNLDHRKAAL